MSERFIELSELDRQLWQRPGFAEAWERVSPPFILADNVNRLRRSRGMTQERLARQAGMRQPRIAEIERADANPTLETLARLARALGVSLPVLLTEQTEEAREPSSGSGASD